MYCRVFQLDVRVERVEDFLRAAREYIEGWLRDEPEAIRFHLVKDDLYNYRYYLIERYDDPDAHDVRAQGALLHRHGRHLAPMLITPPLLLARGREEC